MRRILPVIIVVSALSMAALAQDESTLEVFGGFSHMSHRIGLNGWIASASVNPWEHAGLEGDLSGHYGSSRIVGVKLDSTVYDFNFGPRFFTTTSNDKVTIFGHVLLGGSHISSTLLGGTDSDTSFSWVLGGGADYALGSSWAARGQLDYIRTNLFNTGSNDSRLSVGLVYRFGE